MSVTLFSFLTPKAQTFYLDHKSTIRQVLEKLDSHKFSVVPLVDEEGKFISTISEGDILRYIKNKSKFNLEVAEKESIANIEKYRPYEPFEINMDIKKLFKLSLEQNFVPVVDDRGIYIGIVKRKSIIKYLYSNKELDLSEE